MSYVQTIKNAHTSLIKKIFTQHIIKNTNNKNFNLLQKYNINYFKAMNNINYFKVIKKYSLTCHIM